MEISVKRTPGEVVVVMTEALRELAMRRDPAWSLEYRQDDLAAFNVWTVRIPVDQAGILLRGLHEAGVKP